jgi:hypothetical protein
VKSPSPYRDVAEKIVASMRHNFGAPHTMVKADPSEFGHLDLEAYARFEAEMRERKYDLVADLEILEVSTSPTAVIARTMIRTMLSSDGRVLAQYYQVRPRMGRRIKMLLRGLLNLRLIAAPMSFAQGMIVRHCVSFETEFDDGRHLMTSNAQAAAMLSGPKSIVRHFFPYGTPTAVLIEHHLARVQEITGGDPGKAVAMRTFDDVLEMQKRQNLMKVAHRRSIEWLTQSEMLAMSGSSPETGEAVFAEVQRLLAEERQERR